MDPTAGSALVGSLSHRALREHPSLRGEIRGSRLWPHIQAVLRPQCTLSEIKLMSDLQVTDL